jgi:hypothetical protein
LRESFFEIAPGGESCNRIAIRKLLNDGEGALADGAGGTENGESFQGDIKIPWFLAEPISESAFNLTRTE